MGLLPNCLCLPSRSRTAGEGGGFMNSTILRRVSSVLLAFVLALFCVPALPALAAGESISVEVIGPNAEGAAADYVAPVTYELADGEDCWTLTQRALDENKLTYDAENSTYGVLLNSINSPVDGSTLAFDEASGAYWQLFVDGKASEVGISGVTPADGMKLVWYYSAFGDELPTSVATLAPAAEAAAAPTSSSFPLLPVAGVAVVACAGVAFYLSSRKNA